MLLLAVVAAMMMLVASPALAIPAGSKYWENYYPNGYYNYCHPDGDNYYGLPDARDYCDKYYTQYHKKVYQGKNYYYVHVYYRWYNGNHWSKKDYWYYAKYQKYDDPTSNYPYFRAWVGYKPTDDYYWVKFYHKSS